MDPMFLIPSDDRDNANPFGDVDILSTLGKNPEALINGSQMNPDIQYEMDDFLTSLMPNEKPKQTGENGTFDHTSRHKDLLRENAQLKMLNKKLKLKDIEQESLLANYESKLAQKMKALDTANKEMEIMREKILANETEIDNLKAQVGQLQALVHQYKHLNLQNDGAYEKYSALETKLKRAQGTIKRLKCKLTQNSEKGSDQSESLTLKNHIQRIWKLIVLGNEKAGLTIKQKKKLTMEYEEWFPSDEILLHIKRKMKNLTNILQDLPTNILEVSSTPDNFVETLNSIHCQNTFEVTDLNSPIYSTSTLLSSDYKVSSSDDSPTKTLQPLHNIPDLKSEQLNVPSYPCSPDSLSCHNDANTYSTESPSLSSNQRASLAKNVLNFESSLSQYLKESSDLNCSTKLRLHEVQSPCDKIQGVLEQIPTDIQDSLEQEQSAMSNVEFSTMIQELPDQSPCTVVNTIPLTDMQDSLEQESAITNIEFSTMIQESLDQSPCTVVNTIPLTDMQDSLEQESAITNIEFSTMIQESLEPRSCSVSNTNLSTQLKDPLEQRLSDGISNLPTEIKDSLEQMLWAVSNTALIQEPQQRISSLDITKSSTEIPETIKVRSISVGSSISLSGTVESFSEENKEESNEILSITFNEADHAKDIPLEVNSSSKSSATEYDLAEDCAFSDSSIDNSDVLIKFNQEMPITSALFMENEDGLPIFCVPERISPLPITPPLDMKLKKREKKSLENNLINNAAVPSCEAMERIDFRFVSDKLPLTQNSSFDVSPKHIVCNESHNGNAIIEQSCVPVYTKCSNFEDLELLKTHEDDSAISSKTTLELASNKMSPDKRKDASCLESANLHNSNNAAELLHDLGNDCQEDNFKDAFQKQTHSINPTENKNITLVTEPPTKIPRKNNLDLVKQNDSEFQDISCQQKFSFTYSSTNVQSSNQENLQSKKKQRTVLNAVPVRIRGRTLLNRGVFNKRKIETTTDDEIKEQNELEGDKTLRTNINESLNLSDYTVMCKPKKIRLEHKKAIVGLPTLNSSGITVNTDKKVLVTSGINGTNNNNMCPIKSADVSARKDLDLIGQNDSESQDTLQQTPSCTSFSKNIQSSNQENLQSKEEQRITLSAEISDSVQVRGTLLDGGIFKKQDSETETNNELKEQTELKDQSLGIKPAAIDDKSFTQSDYTRVCKSKKIRIERKKNIVGSTTSNSDNVTMNTDDTLLHTSSVNFANHNSKKDKGKEQPSTNVDAFKNIHTRSLSHSNIKNKASELIALLNLFPSTTKEVAQTDSTSFIECVTNASFNKVPTCFEDFIVSSLINNPPKCDVKSYSASQSSLSVINDLSQKEDCLVPTSKPKDKPIEKRERKIPNENSLNIHMQASNYANNPCNIEISQNLLVSSGNISKSIDDCETSKKLLKPSTISNDFNCDPQIPNSVKKLQNVNNSQAKEHSLELDKKISVLNNKKKRDKSYIKKQMISLRRQLAIKTNELVLKKNKAENPLEKFFQDLQEIQSDKNINYAESLVEVLTNQDNFPNSSVLLFHVLNYLRNSLKNPLHLFSLNEDSSVLLPLDEDCIVTALCMIELKKEPSLDGLLKTAITTINNLILVKKLPLLGLASLCRVFTEICKREKDSLRPVILCGDLLKIKHYLAPFLIASVASVWKELFQVDDSLPVEEKLFQSSILYGACKKPKKLVEFHWKTSMFIISKYFTAPPINNARSAIQILKNFIKKKCHNDSWNSQYMTSALTILAVHEDWDWIKINLLDDYIVTNLIQFGCRTLNKVAFDLYCNLYVDIFILKTPCLKSCPHENYLVKIFNDPEVWRGASFVRECVALALIRLIYMTKKLLPPFLASWFECNHQRPFVQKIIPVLMQRLMRENASQILLQDIA